MNSKKFKIDKSEITFDFPSIRFTSINANKALINIFLEKEDKKILSKDESQQNYHQIIAKEIGVKEAFEDLEFIIVNDIKLKIGIKFKNKFSTEGVSFKDRLNMFKRNSVQIEPRAPMFKPGKLKIPGEIGARFSTSLAKDDMDKNLKLVGNSKNENVEEKNKEAETENKENEEKKEEKENENEKEEKANNEIKEDENKENKEEVEQKTINEPEIEPGSCPKVEEEPEKEAEEKANEQVNEQEKEPEKEPEKTNEQEKEPENTNEQEKEQEEEPEKEQEKTDEQEKEHEKEPEKEQEKEPEKTDEQEKEQEKEPEKEQEKEPEKAVEQEKEPEKEQEKEPEKAVEQEKEPEKTVEQEKTPEKNSVKELEKEPEKKEEKKEEKLKDPAKTSGKEESYVENLKIDSPKPETPNEPTKDEKNIIKEIIDDASLPTPSESKSSRGSEYKKSVSSKIDDDFVVVDKEDFGRASLPTASLLKETYLNSTDYETYLDNLKKQGKKYSDRESFCEGFFITSFPYKDGKINEKEQANASCGHADCATLPSMKPEIIFRYPLKDTKTLELNNLAATICFPTGIKVCYSENGPKKIKDYITPITNQKGERYYMKTFHFYRKMDCAEYTKKYEVNPLKYNLMKFADAYTGLSEQDLTQNLVDKIQKNLEICQELGFREYVYIPYCICLISKYPYIQEMDKCLASIYTILCESTENNSLEINDFIMYLIHSVPIPEGNTKVRFFIPYFNTPLEIGCPKIDDISVMNTNSTKVVHLFSIDNIITIFRLLILEKKILFIDNDYARLANVTDGFISLLYPFQWIHTYIPIMSDQMLKYLETFLPFLNGINQSLMNLVKQVFTDGENEDTDEVFLIYISEDKIKLSSSLKGKNINVDKYIKNNIPALPSAYEKDLKSKLKKLKSEIETMIKNEKKSNSRTKVVRERQNLEFRIRDTFIDMFADMFKGYANYLSFLDGQDTVFNKTLFMEKISNHDKKFYNEIIDTQLFQQFTQNVINTDMDYFNKKVNLKESGEKVKNPPRNLSVSEKIYCVRPDFLNLPKDCNKTEEISKFIYQNYPPIQENKAELQGKISENVNVIVDEKYVNKKCRLYITPESLENKKKEEVVEPKKEVNEKDKKKKKVTTSAGILERLRKMNIKIPNSTENKKKSEELSEKEKDNIKEMIRDWIIKIFKSDELNLDSKTKVELQNNINKPFGREFFISLLTSNKNSKIYLQRESFSLLNMLIKESLLFCLKLDENDKILENIVLLIQSTNYFAYTNEKSETKTIFESSISDIHGNPKITQDNFWQKWYDIDLKGKENPDDATKQGIIYKICDTLIQLLVSKTIVKNITNRLAQKVFGKDTPLQKETFKNFIEKIKFARYTSEA